MGLEHRYSYRSTTATLLVALRWDKWSERVAIEGIYGGFPKLGVPFWGSL